MQIYDILFEGQDFQPVRDAVNRARITSNGDEYFIDSRGKLNQDNKTNNSEKIKKILLCFMAEIAPKGYLNENFVVNTRGRGNSKKLLYDSVNAEDYFQGLVGVIKKQISVNFNDDTDVENGSDDIIFNVTLQITSRFDTDENGNIAKPYFLSTLLLRDKIDLTENMIPSSEDEIFDYLLLFWFKQQLGEALLKGYYKTYIRFEKNDDHIKGTIDIARHIRFNMGQRNGRVAYSYRENTVNNYLNQLIVCAYHHLKNKYFDLVSGNFDNIPLLKRAIDYLENCIKYSSLDVKTLIGKNLRPIGHPYFFEYEELRITCLKILRDEGISIFDGELNQETEGIMFYLPDLWEMFLESAVFDKIPVNNFTYDAQRSVKTFGCYIGDGKYEYNQSTKPDYVFSALKSSGGEPFMIMDAKFKPAWKSVLATKKISEDIMNDYNKCIRDMIDIDGDATGVVFPLRLSKEEAKANYNEQMYKHPLSKLNDRALFYTIPIIVPSINEDEKYEDWFKGFDSEIGDKKGYLFQIISEEQNFHQRILQCKKSMDREPVIKKN